eukprot:COSAG05_NODE_25956_length_192_cov_30.784946_1_plen_57_part_10
MYERLSDLRFEGWSHSYEMMERTELRKKRFRTEKQQQQNENKHISRSKHARRRRGKH